MNSIFILSEVMSVDVYRVIKVSVQMCLNIVKFQYQINKLSNIGIRRVCAVDYPE